MNNCCNKPNDYYTEDHFDIVQYGDRNVRIEYITYHCNVCGKELDYEDLDHEDI